LSFTQTKLIAAALSLAVGTTSIVASPAFAKSKLRYPQASDPARGLYMQSPFGSGAPATPAMMFKGMPYTDPDPSIYYFLIRCYRDEGQG